MIDINKVKNVPELIAKDIEETLGPNHISTSVFGSPVSYNENSDLSSSDSENETLTQPIKLFIVVKSFDENCLVKLSLIFSNWKKRLGPQLESPIITEPLELRGILDSIPEKILELKNNYKIVAGEDLQELSAEPEFEYLRAQAELAIRHHVYSLRHDLFDVLFSKKSMEDYLKQLWVFCISTLRNYHRLVEPELNTTQEHIQSFYDEFPQGKPALGELLEKFYQVLNNRPVDSIGKANLFKLSIGIARNVLQPMLIKVDNMGPKKSLGDPVTFPVDDLINKKIVLKIDSADTNLKEKIQSAFKVRDHELQKRMKLYLGRYKSEYRKRVETEVNRIRDFYSNKYQKDLSVIEKELTERIEINTANSFETKISKERDKLKKEIDQLRTELDRDHKQREKELERVYKLNEKELAKNYREKEQQAGKIFRGKEKKIVAKMRKREEEKIDLFKHKEKDRIARFKQKADKRYEELEKKLGSEIEMNKKEIDLRKKLENEIFEKKEDMKKLFELQIECERNKLEAKRLEFDLSLKDKELDILKQHSRTKYYKPRPEFEDESPDENIEIDYEPESEGDLFKKILNDNKSLKWTIKKES
jgi:hypothetical protein